MREYYAVVRSTDELAHYGVKGMKWGVRKAISKDSKALSRQYQKAIKKLAKLDDRANTEKQKQAVQKYNKGAKRALKIGLISAGASGVGSALSPTVDRALWARRNRLMDTEFKRFDSLPWNNMKQYAKDSARSVHNATEHAINRERKTLQNVHGVATIGAAALGAGALGAAAVQKAKAQAAKKRLTSAGHAKAVAKRDAWKAEMNKAFAGTKYAGQYATPARKKKRK